MKSSIAFGLASGVALVMAATVANAADSAVGLGAGDFLVHVRAVGVFPDVSGHDTLLNGKIDIDENYIPEIDASYFFTDHLAAELIAGTTQHTVRDNSSALGETSLGRVWLLPPTLTAQYHPLSHSLFDPYAGAGINYTIFYGAGGAQNILGDRTRVVYKNGFGYALQVGANYEIRDGWFFNVDLKKIFVSTSADVELNGVRTTHARVDVDPWLAGVGIGYRF